MAKDELPPSPPFRSRPPKYRGGLEECCKPQWSVGQSPSRHDLVHIGVKKCSSGGSSFVDFAKNKCNFLHKNKLDIIWRVQILIAQCPMRSFLLQQSPPLPYGSWHLWQTAKHCKRQPNTTRVMDG